MHIVCKSAAKFHKLAVKRQFTEIFMFEEYHRSEKLELTRKNEYEITQKETSLC